MNKIPPQAESRGLLAYEQARAFENLQRWRLPWVYGGMAVLLLVSGGAMLRAHHPLFGLTCLLMGVGLALTEWFHGRWLRARHARNLLLLLELEKQYGEALPWIRMERHFAALEELQRELKSERGDGTK